MPAAWVIRNGFADPMALWRGRYTTEDGGRELIDAAGGLQFMFERGLRDAGVPAIGGDPQAGDVAVLELLGEQAGAVYTGERWALVADRGLAFVGVRPEVVVQIWRVVNG